MSASNSQERIADNNSVKTIKKTIKKILPSSVVSRIHLWKMKRLLFKETNNDASRFLSTFASPNSFNQKQIRSKMIFYVHQIEKGFSFDEYQYGRGKNALNNLGTLIERLKNIDPNWRESAIYLDAIQTLGEYRKRHLATGHDISFMTNYFTDLVNDDIRDAAAKEYPNITITKKSKDDNSTVSFSELVERRHAIRTYSDEPVYREEIKEAIQMSLRTPSVCNRQPARVRIYQNKELISKILKIQGGFGGYDTPPALLLVTADLQSFIGINEHNEGYIDGGLFSMSLLYSLEAVGLAACPLNAMFTIDSDQQMRALLQIPDNEVFIMYIAVGHFQELSKICLSQRFDIDQVVMN